MQRRQSPGLTQTQQSSVSFAPLQSLFGIVTPSGLHFERHRQDWWDVDPSRHRLMVNGADEKMVRTSIEDADGSSMTRTIPMELTQNRPEGEAEDIAKWLAEGARR